MLFYFYMAIKQSAKKGVRQSKRRQAMNQKRKKKVKILIKEARILVDQKKIEEAKKILPQIYKALDKAAKKNTIKKNTASRKKSRIAKMMAKTIA